MPKIYRYIEEILSGFVKTFKTDKLLKTFIFVILCMMIRAGFDGLASLVRVFAAQASVCGIVWGFFKSGGWLLSNLIFEWTKMFKGREEVYRIDGMPALVGERANVEKSGEKMPGVKGLSVGSHSKAEKIKGRMFGAAGIVQGVKEKLFCTPLSIRLHEGLHGVAAWTGGAAAAVDSHLARLAREACEAAAILGEPCFLAMDAAFLTREVLATVIECATIVILVTRARANTVAYSQPDLSPRRGRPAKKGAAVKIRDYFASASFIDAHAPLYGANHHIEYSVVDLLWGKGLYAEVRFVCVRILDQCRRSKSIYLACSSKINPVDVISVYCLRFKVETMFRALKQNFSAFYYHFWDKCMPKINGLLKGPQLEALMSTVNDAHERELILKTINAIESYVMTCSIACGIVQPRCVKFRKLGLTSRVFQRTRGIAPSESTMIQMLRSEMPSYLKEEPGSALALAIKEFNKGGGLGDLVGAAG